MNKIDLSAILIQQEIAESRRRFNLHVLWATVCVACSVISLIMGLVWGAVTVLK